MSTKIYHGNYTLQVGMPYVFITVRRDASVYRIELIVLFAGFDGTARVKGRNYRFPVDAGFTEDNVFEHSVELAKEFILYEVVLKYYEHRLHNATFPPIDLRETNYTTLMFLKKKYPEALRLVRKFTSSTLLHKYIDLYSGIQFKEDETYGDDE